MPYKEHILIMINVLIYSSVFVAGVIVGAVIMALTVSLKRKDD